MGVSRGDTGNLFRQRCAHFSRVMTCPRCQCSIACSIAFRWRSLARPPVRPSISPGCPSISQAFSTCMSSLGLQISLTCATSVSGPSTHSVPLPLRHRRYRWGLRQADLSGTSPALACLSSDSTGKMLVFFVVQAPITILEVRASLAAWKASQHAAALLFAVLPRHM